jgi:hypothetical protein
VRGSNEVLAGFDFIVINPSYAPVGFFFQALSIQLGVGSRRWKGSRGGVISSERDILLGVLWREPSHLRERQSMVELFLR